MKWAVIHVSCTVVICAGLFHYGVGADPAGTRPDGVPGVDCGADWDYEKLFAKAETVVIAAPASSEPTDETLNILKTRGIDLDLGGVNTKFAVRLVLKGKPGKELVVFHYRVTGKRQAVLENPPELVEFRTKPLIVDVDDDRTVVPPPSYLLFLTKRVDGRYTPLSGDLDPVDSVFELSSPWSDSLSLKR